MAKIALGLCPEMEDGIFPVGSSKEYMPLMTSTAKAYIIILKKKFKTMLVENNKVYFSIEEFCKYKHILLQVYVNYNEMDEIETQFANIIEHNLPQFWQDDDEFYVCL